jgi:peptide/nickel transport system substrate-binding protein
MTMLTRRRLGGLTAATAIAAATPLRHGLSQSAPTLTIAVDNLWQTMAPLNGISTTSLRVFPNFYDRLVERDYIAQKDGLELRPKLATRLERNGNVWNITLRQGVKFHNGVEMTADDVAFTLSEERLWGARAIEPRGRTFTGGFKRVTATGRYTVEIETERPDPYIPGKLSLYIGMVVPKAYYQEQGVDKFGQAPIGAGPYKVTQFRSAEHLILDRFDDYWGDKAKPARVIFKIVPEFAARMAGLVSGEFDFITNIPTDQEKVLERYRNINVVRRQVDNYPAVAFNVLPDPPDNPLVDPNLRYAMVQGVDMHGITKALFGDATFHPDVPMNFTEYGRFYDPSLKAKLPYAPAAARDLVRRTSYNGQKLIWHITRQFYPNYESAAEVMVEQWKEIGVNVEARVLDNFDLVYRRPFHMMNFANATSFIPGDPYQPLWIDWGPTAVRSTASWKTWTPTEKFIELGRAFDATSDFEERKKAFFALRDEWERVTPAFYMWKSVFNWAHRTGIEWKPIGESEMRMYGDYLKLT